MFVVVSQKVLVIFRVTAVDLLKALVSEGVLEVCWSFFKAHVSSDDL